MLCSCVTVFLFTFSTRLDNDFSWDDLDRDDPVSDRG